MIRIFIEKVCPAILPNGFAEISVSAYCRLVRLIEVVVAAADREHASAEHIDQAVHDPRRIAPIREHPGQIVGQTETPLGHRQKHHAPVRG
ncbi:hypothetical protein ACVMHY_007844 [Bradyrhizobium barranii subsp. barranii]